MLRRKEKEKQILKQQHLARRFLLIFAVFLAVSLSLTLMYTRVKGNPGPAAILRLSLPSGTYQGVNPDPWLSEGWLLNVTGASGTFTLNINNTSASLTSYDSHLIIALNNASYNNFVSLSVNITTISKTDFTYGTPNPYGVWNWPSGDVYPTWFADTYIFGTLDPKGYKNLIISVTFSNATGARMHFDGYGSEVTPPPPPGSGKLTHNAISGDSTVLFWPSEVERFYLTVVSPYGVTSGEGWYDEGSTAYAALDTGLVDHGNGTRRVFTNWSGDASGTDYAQSDPILMDGPKTAIAVWKTQYLLTVRTQPTGLSPRPTRNPTGEAGPTGSWWYDDSTDVTLTAQTVANYTFVNWDVDTVSQGNGVNPITVHMNQPNTATAHYEPIQPAEHYLTVVSPYGVTSGEGWYDEGSTAYAALDTGLVDHGNGTRRVFTNWSGDASGTDYAQSDPILMDGPKTAIAVWKTQYQLTVRTNGLGTVLTNVYNGTTILGNATDAKPYTDWFDKDSLIMLNIDEPATIPEMTVLFTHWSGDAIGSIRPINVAMNSAKDITANYKTQYLVIFGQTGVASDFNGTIVIIDGTPYNKTTLPFFWWDEGSIHSFAFQSPLVVTPNAKRYVWDSTSGLSSLQSDSITVSTFGSIIGNYKIQYYLTLATSPPGVNTPSGEGWYHDGTDASISTDEFEDIVLGASRYRFNGWTTTDMAEITNPSSPTTTVLMDKAKTVTANYVTQYKLTVKTDPQGLSPGPTPPTDWYDESTNVTLTAQAVSEYTFDYWDVDGDSQGSGVNPITVHMDAPHTATAHYEPIQPAEPRPRPVGGVWELARTSGPSTDYTLFVTALVAVITQITSIAVHLKRRAKKKQRFGK